MMISCILPVCGSSSSPFLGIGNPQPLNLTRSPWRRGKSLNPCGRRTRSKSLTAPSCKGSIVSGLLPLIDPWSPTIDSQSVASQLFAFSLFPYLGFLYFITKSKSTPKLSLFGFYFLLTFVGATIPAGIYAKVRYGTSLSNVDWLHGGAESLLTLTNLFIVMGLRAALRELNKTKKSASK